MLSNTDDQDELIATATVIINQNLTVIEQMDYEGDPFDPESDLMDVTPQTIDHCHT